MKQRDKRKEFWALKDEGWNVGEGWCLGGGGGGGEGMVGGIRR